MNDLVMVTGATAGIGAACARRFAAEGADLVLWARREDRLASLAGELEREHGVRVHAGAVDVTDRTAVFEQAAALLERELVPHVLVNNAGLGLGSEPFQESEPGDWDRMIDTNVKGLLNATRRLLPAMIEAGRGHVINIGSILGRWTRPAGHVYGATKYAVRALTRAINLDVAGTAIRVSSVDPGFVETEFSQVRFRGDEARAEAVYEGFEPLTGDDIADAVLYVAGAPAHVNVLELVLVPTAQRNVYVVHRE